jgi:DNA (cytosine-5)-methyltransferase 1
VPSLTVGSLFSGIGGIDLGLERAGHRVLWHSEIDKYACRVLKKHWPDIPNLGDVKLINWSEVPNVDIIAGGYPCQPFSTAGKRKGKEDPRHLWPYVLDAIRAIRPRYALMENVRGHLTLGFGDVLADLASCGYSAEWQIISAASVGAPHRRDRLFFVAYPDSERSHRTEVNSTKGRQSALVDSARCGEEMADSDDARNRAPERNMERERSTRFVFGDDSLNGISGRSSTMADSTGRRLEEREPESETTEDPRLGSSHFATMANTDGDRRRRFRPLADDREEVFGREDYSRGEDGVSGRAARHWETEPGMGRLAHGIPDRVDRLRGLGNAVVPYVAELVGRLISQHADSGT